MHEAVEPKKRFAPKGAITKECSYCKNGAYFTCESRACKLNDPGLGALKKIRGHCLTCVGTSDEVKKCTGKVLSPEPHVCYLREFCFGKNPSLVGKRGKGNPEALRLFRELSHHGALKFL